MTALKFETGASTHAVNDLILFTDNTKELAAIRDAIYTDWAKTGNFGTARLYERFIPLFQAAQKSYKKEFAHSPYSYHHIALMTHNECVEYCNLYVLDFNNWKQEHGLK